MDVILNNSDVWGTSIIMHSTCHQIGGFWLSQRERQKVTSRLSLQVGEVENFPKLMRKKTPRIDPYPIIL